MTMNNRLSHTVYGISAHRADIKLRAEHIRGNIRIVNRISGYQLCDRNPERPCDWFQQGNVWVSFGSLPFRDRLVTYSKLFRQLKLGHFVSFTQFLNNRTCNILVHNRTLLSHRYRHSPLPACHSVEAHSGYASADHASSCEDYTSSFADYISSLADYISSADYVFSFENHASYRKLCFFSCTDCNSAGINKLPTESRVSAPGRNTTLCGPCQQGRGGCRSPSGKRYLTAALR